MFSIRKLLAVVLMLPLMAACVPVATSHAHDTEDGRHRGVQITMHSGVVGTPVQTVMLIYNSWTSQPVAVVSGQSLRLGDRLLDAVLDLGPAIVQGEYILRAEEIGCPPGTLCGTLVQVNASSGSTANADADALIN